MNEISKISLVEKKRGIGNQKRQYDIFFNEEKESPSLEITESSNFFKSLFRLTSGSKDESAAFKMSILQNGEKIYGIRKKIGPFEMSPFRLTDNSGNPLYTVANRIKMSDDSFIEIEDTKKNVLFKSGLSDSSSWFPVSLYEAEKAETDLMTISGEVYASIHKTKSGGFGRMYSGQEYELKLATPTTDLEHICTLITYMVALDFNWDNRH